MSQTLSPFTPLSLIAKAVTLLLVTSSCVAAETNKDNSSPISVGVGAFYAPKYTGAEKYEIRAIPLISATYGRFTIGGMGGLSYDIVKSKGLKAGVSLGYFKGRDESDSKYLRGLGDVDSAATIGTYFKQSFGSFYISGNVKRDFSDDVGGITAGLSTGFSYKVTPQIMLNTSVSARWMNDDYAQAVFGVSSEQAAASGFDALSVKSGIESATLSLTGLYFVDKKWTVTAMIGTTNYMGDAKSSPITREQNPYMVMSGVSYRF
ncbi:MAG: MipA/OmpV family protein [Cognaticolwellia sp.]